jgi:hypothetical protein
VPDIEHMQLARYVKEIGAKIKGQLERIESKMVQWYDWPRLRGADYRDILRDDVVDVSGQFQAMSIKRGQRGLNEHLGQEGHPLGL